MLRHPSFADGEFKDLLASFDSAFLGIFPDFVDRVNEHMQEEHLLKMPSKGELSTELRILALIRMGISKRQKIAKVLNVSVTTVYSYHCNLQKHSLHPDSSFDNIIANL
jgi:DNA-binding NarL/FixJ family response regulator